MAQETTPNHLAGETSPYLLQHVNNPVDWYPWGEEALERSKQEGKPIFLSIGYSACHWCHVMEHESFEDPKVAAFLNEHFICIKVDREERPDLDDIYMAAVQKMTGSGGWPLSVWLTPELKPFYGGTYFPPASAHGRPGFLELNRFLADAWVNRRADIDTTVDSLHQALQTAFPELGEDPTLGSAEDLRRSQEQWVSAMRNSYDSIDGGFGQAPKFPRPEDLRFLLAAAHRLGDGIPAAQAQEMSLFTLRKMTEGGMYDRLAGGFARYSVDGQWLIPHFEKMLYDQGTLIPAYLDAYRLSGDEDYAKIVRQTCDYLLREMVDEDGGFHSSTDADSEGVEGKFFVWTPTTLTEALGEERAAFAAALYGVTEAGNFEHGWSVLTDAMPPQIAARKAGLPLDQADALAEEVRAALYDARLQRIPPGTDDKVLTAWNGLAIDALAMAGRQLDEPRYTAAAARAADFLLQNMRKEDGRLIRAWRKGKAQHAAVLEDYAYFTNGLLSLFMSTGEERWLTSAADLGTLMLEDFWDEKSGVFFDTDGRDTTLVQRMQQPWDGATPAPNAVALQDLLILHAFTQDQKWFAPAHRGFGAVKQMAFNNPRAFASTLRPYAWAVQEPGVAVVVGTGADSLGTWRAALASTAYADALPVLRADADPESEVSLFTGRPAVDGKATLYFCEGQTCRLPLTEPVE
ncbi:MAG: thioredoxin domain-containing protein [Planctomycetota bacterium]